jgi:hypothetical protein
MRPDKMVPPHPVLRPDLSVSVGDKLFIGHDKVKPIDIFLLIFI